MRRKSGEQDEPPDARWRQQKRCDQDRIWRPKDRNRMRLEGERKTNLGTKIISNEHAQPDHGQVPVKRRTETVYVPRCWLNARGFKRLGETLHLQRNSTVFKASSGSNGFSDNREDIFRKGPLLVPFPMCLSRLRSQRPKDQMPLSNNVFPRHSKLHHCRIRKSLIF
jgi:hypothetical protein